MARRDPINCADDTIVNPALSPELETLRTWILSKRRSPAPVAVHLDTDLLGTRVIDSLDFAEFLFVIEEAYGLIIELESVNIETFRTLASIDGHFARQG